MAILNRDQIQQAQDTGREEVPVPEWGGEVLVKGLSASQRLVLAGKLAEFKDVDWNNNPDPQSLLKMLEVQAEVVCCTVVDEQGQCLFSVEQDAGWLKDKSNAALERVFTAALRLSGLAPGAVEQAVKNS